MLHRLTGSRAMISILSVALTVACLAPAQAQDAKEMEAMMAAATPGPHHAALASKAGSYKTTSTMWVKPGDPPMETVGTAELEATLGGRFIEEVTKATMMGMPWEGRGVFGYDNVTGKHTGVWYDSFGTMMMTFEGTCEEHCKKISLTSTYIDPMTKTEKAMKSVSVDKGNGNSLTTLYDLSEGKEMKIVEIIYERVSDQAKR